MKATRRSWQRVRCLIAAYCLVAVFSLLGKTSLRADEGWTAQFEQLFLATHISNEGARRIFYGGYTPSITEAEGDVDSPLQYATRLTVAREGSQGGGVQLRWFSFDDGQSYTGRVREGGPWIQLAGDLNLDVDALDIELTQRSQFRFWEIQATAGVRYAEASLREGAINFESLTDFAWSGSTGYDFSGAGPTVSLLGEREFGNSGMSIYARARTALLFGDLEHFSAFRPSVYSNSGDFLQIWEFQIGTNIERRYNNYDLIGGMHWEAQRWDSDSDLFGDLAFHGFGVNTGLRF